MNKKDFIEDIDKDMDVIGSNSNFNGNFNFASFTRIEGNLTGTIDSKGILIISETAKVSANITAEKLIVFGKLEGTINLSKELLLGSGCFISGQVTTPLLEIQEGANVEASISMSNK